MAEGGKKGALRAFFNRLLVAVPVCLDSFLLLHVPFAGVARRDCDAMLILKFTRVVRVSKIFTAKSPNRRITLHLTPSADIRTCPTR